MGLSLGRLGLVALGTWLALLFYISTTLVRVQVPAYQEGESTIEEALRRIKQAGSDIEALRRQNEELKALLFSGSPPPSVPRTPAAYNQLAHLSDEHESARRSVERGTWELWYMTRGELGKIRDKAAPDTKERLASFLGDATRQWESLLAQVQRLGTLDGAEEWRRRQLANLTTVVQARILKLQNPPDCNTAKKLLCQLNKGCGFGCQIHHASYCAIVAYATQRTLVLEAKGWRYSSRGWTSVFKPVGSCDSSDVSNAVQWKGPSSHLDDLVVSLPIVDSLRPRWGVCHSAGVSNAVQWKGPSSHLDDLVVSLPIVDSLRPRWGVCHSAGVSNAVQWKGPSSHLEDLVVSLPIVDSLRPRWGVCHSAGVSNAVQWKGPSSHLEDLVVSLPIVDSLRPSPEFLPLSFPAEMGRELVHLHGNPPAWWVGQFVTYLMRFATPLEEELKAKGTAMQFRGPIVGLHVRRTDKLGSEAQFHALSEYMDWARRWFELRERRGQPLGKGEKRRVFLATDDKGLLAEARKSYPDWDVMGSADVAASAQLSSRYSDSSLHGVIQDIHFLSLSDHLVCTFSSQVCRVAYELMQVRQGDWASEFDSLDDLFYFGGQHGHEVTAVLGHEPRKEAPAQGPGKEIAILPGDTIGIAGNHWDGWSKGRNTRTGETGLFPSYKVKEKWRIVPFGPAHGPGKSDWGLYKHKSTSRHSYEPVLKDKDL